MSAKFTVYLDKAKQFRFNLKAANGEIIAVGESYPDKKSCLKGIASIQKNAPIAKIVDATKEAGKAEKAKAAKPKAAKPKVKAKAAPKAKKAAAPKAKKAAPKVKKPAPAVAKPAVVKPAAPAEVKPVVAPAVEPAKTEV